MQQKSGLAKGYLGFQYGKPELLGLDDSFGSALPLILLVQGVKLLPPTVCQARSFIGAKQGPLPVGLHPPHEQVVHP